MNKLTLKDIMDRYPITPRTIRYYEDEGLIHLDRNDKKHRIFDDKACKRIETILFLKSLGMSLQEIKQHFDDDDIQSFINQALMNKKREATKEISKLDRQMSEIETIRAQYIDHKILNIMECEHFKVKHKNTKRCPCFESISTSKILICIFLCLDILFAMLILVLAIELIGRL